MKRIAIALIVLLAATSLFAGGGKECNINRDAKSVELTGTIVRTDGDHARTIFRVANSDESYTVCEKTKSSVLKLSKDGKDTLRIKGKLVSCSEGAGQELVIESAKKI